MHIGGPSSSGGDVVWGCSLFTSVGPLDVSVLSLDLSLEKSERVRREKKGDKVTKARICHGTLDGDLHARVDTSICSVLIVFGSISRARLHHIIPTTSVSVYTHFILIQASFGNNEKNNLCTCMHTNLIQ